MFRRLNRQAKRRLLERDPLGFAVYLAWRRDVAHDLRQQRALHRAWVQDWLSRSPGAAGRFLVSGGDGSSD